MASIHAPRSFQDIIEINKVVKNATGLPEVIYFYKSLGVELEIWRAKLVNSSTLAPNS